MGISARAAAVVAKYRRRSARAAQAERIGQRAEGLASSVRSAVRGALPHVLAIELLVICQLLLFRDAISDLLIFHEADTSTMFFPIFTAFWQAVQRGEMLRWTPHLFSGFPLLAEGQTGVFYPLNWLMALALPAEEGFVWLRVLHFGIAALGAYLLGISLRFGSAASAILALSFSQGSFLVGQMQHGSVLASAVWLPWLLAFTELAFRSLGEIRLRYSLLAAIVLGVATLGVHVQTVVLMGGCFLAWVTFRALVPPVQRGNGPTVTRGLARAQAVPLREARGLPIDEALPRRETTAAAAGWRLGSARARYGAAALGRGGRRVAAHLTFAALIALLVPVLGAGLGAAQLAPLYELSQFSGRSGSWTYLAATDYSLPIPNLLTLVFPFFFRDQRGASWSLWQGWEVTYYAGVVTLALAVLGLVFSRRREALLFGLMTVIATLLALGDYSPINLYQQIWNLPGVNLQRAPARFSFIAVLGLAGLAGLGAQKLTDTLALRPDISRRTAKSVVVWLSALVLSLAVILGHLVVWRNWLEQNPIWATRVLSSNYLGLRHDAGIIDSAQRAYSGLWGSLDLANRFTAAPLLFVAALVVLTLCWNELRQARPLWQAGLTLLVAADLGHFAHNFHPLVPLSDVADIGPVGRFLEAQQEPIRIYTDPLVKAPKANTLLPAAIGELRAYDPLELARHRVMMGAVGYVDNWLLDLLGARFHLLPSDGPALPSYQQTGFNPQQPLLSGAAGNPSGKGSWSVPNSPGDELRVITSLEDAHAIADGEIVGEWSITDARGVRVRLPLRAGIHTADWSYDDPELNNRPAHGRPTVAYSFDLPGKSVAGARQVSLYYASFALANRPAVKQVEFSYSHAVGRVQVFGLGLYDRQTGQVSQFFLPEKYSQVLTVDEVVVRENRAVFPRAFLAIEGLTVRESSQAMHWLAFGPLEPRRQIILEEPEGTEVQSAGWAEAEPGVPPRSEGPYGETVIEESSGERVVVRTSAPDEAFLVLTDAHYPGWRAFVDGRQAEIRRADYLFRAVQVPAGEHTVEFQFLSTTHLLGEAASGVMLLLIAVALIASLGPSSRDRDNRLAPS